MSRRRNSKDWISTPQIAEALGCSIDHLYRLRNSGRLKKGTHWYSLNDNAARQTYKWNLKRVKEVLGVEQ